MPSRLPHGRFFVLLQPLSPIQTFLEDQRYVAESEQYGDLDERTDGRCQRLVRVDPVHSDAYGDGQFKATHEPTCQQAIRMNPYEDPPSTHLLDPAVNDCTTAILYPYFFDPSFLDVK